MQNSLTSLANAKAWAGVTTNNDDALLTRLIGSASLFILSNLLRPTLFQNVFTDLFDGVGQRGQMLRNYPVLSVASVLIDNQSIPVAVGQTSCGYVLDPWDGFPPGKPQSIALRGYSFCRGDNNIAITYTSGFVVQNEVQTIPADSTYIVNVNAPNGNFAVDQGVTFASNGAALAPITSGTPASGQYLVQGNPMLENFGQYTFAAGDAGKGVLVSYSYVPADIEQACCELVGERYKVKDRIGYVSKSLGGQETVTFSQKKMSDFVGGLLLPYKRVVLV